MDTTSGQHIAETLRSVGSAIGVSWSSQIARGVNASRKTSRREPNVRSVADCRLVGDPMPRWVSSLALSRQKFAFVLPAHFDPSNSSSRPDPPDWETSAVVERQMIQSRPCSRRHVVPSLRQDIGVVAEMDLLAWNWTKASRFGMGRRDDWHSQASAPPPPNKIKKLKLRVSRNSGSRTPKYVSGGYGSPVEPVAHAKP